MSKIEWVKLAMDIGSPHTGFTSKHRVLGWWFILDKRNITSLASQWDCDAPYDCHAPHADIISTRDLLVPKGINSIVIGCVKCKIPLYRIVGFEKYEWEFYTTPEIARG